MYLEEITILNYGAIENLNFKLPFNVDGTPKPIILVGRNGVGKTLLLSNIIHSLIEIKRKVYRKIQEVSDNRYYRIGSKQYIRVEKNYSYIGYKYTFANFSDVVVNDIQKFKENEYNTEIHKDININNNELINDGFFNNISAPQKDIFRNNIFLYFPVDRYYVPNWLNKDNENLHFITENMGSVGYADSDMIRDNILEDINTWILDVIIDKLLYEEQNVPLSYKMPDETIVQHGVHKLGYHGKNTKIQIQINEIINKLFTKNTLYSSVRFGISK